LSDDDNQIPQPEDIYLRTKEEGERRLQRPVVEEISTALAAGFDIVAGVILLGVLGSLLRPKLGVDAAHVVASIGFGVGFVFIVVGRGELFTENFLVPIAGLDRRDGASWRNLAKLWTLSPIFNLVGGTIIILIVSTHNVLPNGAGTPIVDAASKIHGRGTLALFVNAIFAGALITAMTWFVEGLATMGVRVTVAWITGAFLALAGLNHVIVVTLELIFGIRFGAHIPWSFVLGNFFLAAAGNMIGGIGLVTLNRFTQARSGGKTASG
jgi:formate/nitrite transporter FocA (FNT family)